MDDQMDDKTDGWNDASRRPLLYVILAGPVCVCDALLL